MAETEKILLQLELDVSQTITNLEKAKAALSTFKNEQANLNTELKKLEDAGQKGSVAFQNLERQLIANKAAQQNATTEVRNYEKQLRLAVAANEAQIGSNDQLKAQLSVLTAEWNALAAAGRENTQEGIALAQAISLNTEKLNEQEQSVGNFKRQVGDYGVAAKTLKQEIREATNEATTISRQFGENSKAAVEAAKRVSELREEYDDFNKRVAALNPEQKLAAFGQVASGIAGGFTAAQGAMAIFGDESEAVGATLVKLQAALAISQGIKQFNELGDSFKNLRLIIFGTSAAKEVDTAVTQTNAVAQVEGAVAAETLAAGETVATAATGRLSLALRALLVGSGLILIPIAVNAATEAFDIFGKNAKQSIDQLIDSLASEDEAHKKNIEDLKAKNAAETTELENTLAIAKAKGASIDTILQKETELRNAKVAGLVKERTENDEHLRILQEKQDAFANDKIQHLSADQLKEVLEKRKANEEEIRATELKNKELVTAETKLQTEIATINIEADQKRIDEQNKLSNLRINLIRNDHLREIEQIKQSGKEKLDAIKDEEDDAAEKRILISQETEQKIADASRAFALKTLQEKNQLAVALTREGTIQRVAAEINAATSERDELLKNTKLTETQRQLIIADTTNKVRELEDQRLGIIEQHNQQEIELENRKQQAKIAIEKSEAGTDIQKQLAARLNEIQFTAQASIDAKEREADELKAAAQREITDHEQLQQRINEIDQTIAAEKLAIIKQSATDIAAATQEANSASLQKLVDQRQLEVEAADPSEEFAAHLALLNASEEKELAAVGLTEAQKDLIRKKFAKSRAQVEKQQEDATLDFASNTLGQLAGLFKKQSAAYKVFASAQALIDTYKAITLALATYPPPYGEIAAGVAGAVGFANVAKINSVEFYDGGYDSPTGYTGDGNPRDVALSHSNPRRTVHKKEYIIDHSTLALPHVASFVSNVIEPTRLRKTNYTNRASMAGGGFSDTFFVANRGNEMSVAIVSELQSMTDAILNSPAPVVLVEDINAGVGRVAQVEQRANI